MVQIMNKDKIVDIIIFCWYTIYNFTQYALIYVFLHWFPNKFCKLSSNNVVIINFAEVINNDDTQIILTRKISILFSYKSNINYPNGIINIHIADIKKYYPNAKYFIIMYTPMLKDPLNHITGKFIHIDSKIDILDNKKCKFGKIIL